MTNNSTVTCSVCGEKFATQQGYDEHDCPIRRQPASKVIQKWADPAMWLAEPHQDPQEPKVTLTWGPEDPLGLMAMINGQYTGKVYRSPSEVTDQERREAWDAAVVSRLSETPMEWFQVSILFENVTRAFTHQLVRTRMATYAQESLRFAVKEDIGDAVKLPPSIASTKGNVTPGAEDGMQDPEWQRNVWDHAVHEIQQAYLHLVEAGMPAEDARGLLPTNTLTRVHMRTDIKTLLNLAGLRLCTQAQFEWRAVFAKLAEAFRKYDGMYANTDGYNDSNNWQYRLVAERFRPVCYAANKCTMKSKADRYCAIRERVDAFEKAGIPSDGWHSDGWVDANRQPLDGIQPVEWLANPRAAIPKEW